MEKKDFYEGEYMPQMHKIGKLTGFLTKPDALSTAFISAASAIALL